MTTVAASVRVASCRVEIDDEAQRVRTTFADGSELVATPQHDAESIARARSLGYTGTDEEVVWGLTRDHDLLHSLLAEAQGLGASPTLHAVARGARVDPVAADMEERAVLLIQRLLNVGLAGVLADG